MTLPKVFFRVGTPRERSRWARTAHRFAGPLLAPLYWAVAHASGTPGLKFQRSALLLAVGLVGHRSFSVRGLVHELLSGPMDSVRYFEFEFAWTAVERIATGARYLDVSSPRLFPILALRARPDLQTTLVNPDGADMQTTRDWLRAIGFLDRCETSSVLIEDVPFAPGSLDLITSISVVEHIPGDTAAIQKMWDLLIPGGTLVLTVPVAAAGLEEFININEYGLLSADPDGYVFGQRFYDEGMLAERIFSVTGPPASSEVYGEKRPGLFARDRQQKVTDSLYPKWRQPWMMAREYRYYSSVAELPGWGVLGMRFIKPAVAG